MIDNRKEASVVLVSPWPPFKGGSNKESEHPADDVVVMEVVPLPFPIENFLNIGNIKKWSDSNGLLPVC